VPILLNLERTVDGGTFDNLITMIIHCPVIFGWMSKIGITNKVVCFGVDGVTIFQGFKTSVTTQLINKHCPLLWGFIVWRINVILLSRLYHP